jgi:hypothetical protein
MVRLSARTALAAVLASSLFVSACGDDDDDLTGPQLIGTVEAFRDPAADFTTKLTFALVDSVVHLAPFVQTGTLLDVSRAHDQAVIDRVRINLLARGYVEETDPFNNGADMYVLLGASAQENYQAWVAYPWYTWYGFYSGFEPQPTPYDASWNVIYPWSGSAVAITSFSRGSLLVQVIGGGPQINPLAKEVTAIWAGVAIAVLNSAVTQDVMLAAVDQMFVESPYFRRN